MAVFPKIQSPCPYRNQLASIMDGDNCRLCHRQVVDLSPMDDGERRAFLAGCAEEVCVSYRVPAKSAAAAAFLAAAALLAPLPAAAQEVTDLEYESIIVGGIKDMAKVEYVEDTADKAIPVLPVIEDDQPAAPKKADAPATTDEPAPPAVSVRPAP